MEKQKKSSFSGSLGFVMAAAGSAVGLGNIWRFPYLAAKHGGGLFLVVYVLLVLFFGFALLMTDIAIGRKTGLKAGNAYGAIHKKWKFVGHLTFLVPAIILTYYVVIGGWIFKYLLTYITFDGVSAAGDSYFSAFAGSPVSPVVYMLIYLAITAVIVYAGVEKGIEKFSKIVMPCLIVLVAGISVYSLTLSYTTGEVTRTGIEGAGIYFIPNFDNLSWNGIISLLLDATIQVFYSLSVSMGIMITYGSYVKRDVDINRSVTQIQLFDTLVAVLSGLMIVPAVYVFMGTEGMTEGAGLMFVALPKVFNEMGVMGNVIGILFFVMVAFAALTSSVSIMETVVASCMEYFKKSRKQICLWVAGICAACGAVICLGEGILNYGNIWLPKAEKATTFLGLADYVSTSVIMPVITIATCILIGWVVKPKWVIDEVESSCSKFGRKKLFVIIIKYVAPVVMTVLLLSALGIL